MAQAKPKPPQEAKPQYVMPPVEVGDSVYWHDSQDAAPVAMALVTTVGGDSVNLAVLGDGYQNFLIRTGVRHHKNPHRQLVEATGEGVWSHRPGTIRTQDRLLTLETLVNDLSAAALASAR
jgi:hypothetical protein